MFTSGDLVSVAKQCAAALPIEWDSDLEVVLDFLSQSPEKAVAFSSRRKLAEVFQMDDATGLRAYLDSLVGSYYRERDLVPQLSTSATRPDPAVDEVLSYFATIERSSLADIAEWHRLSMAAENLVGKLLERYLAAPLRPHGWVWCCGPCVRAVDFIRPGPEGFTLLQVKNRSNSENSSSSAVRAGTTILKWYRVHARNGRTMWASFPEDLPPGTLSEAGFLGFIQSMAAAADAAGSPGERQLGFRFDGREG